MQKARSCSRVKPDSHPNNALVREDENTLANGRLEPQGDLPISDSHAQNEHKTAISPYSSDKVKSESGMQASNGTGKLSIWSKLLS